MAAFHYVLCEFLYYSILNLIRSYLPSYLMYLWYDTYITCLVFPSNISSFLLFIFSIDVCFAGRRDIGSYPTLWPEGRAGSFANSLETHVNLFHQFNKQRHNSTNIVGLFNNVLCLSGLSPLWFAYLCCVSSLKLLLPQILILIIFRFSKANILGLS